MTALPTSAGYRDVTPDELVTLVTAHKNDKVSVSFMGTNSSNVNLYIVTWTT